VAFDPLGFIEIFAVRRVMLMWRV